MVYVPETTPLSEKLALAAPAATVPEVAVPIVVAPCFTVNVTVPSFTVAVDGLFAVTFAVRLALPPVVPLAPAIEECLLVPFYVQGKAAGTIWANTRSSFSGVLIAGILFSLFRQP